MDHTNALAVPKRLLAAGLVALAALLGAIGVSTVSNANAADTSSATPPAFQQVQSGAPESAQEAPDGRGDGDCPKGGGGEQQQPQQEAPSSSSTETPSL